MLVLVSGVVVRGAVLRLMLSNGLFALTVVVVMGLIFILLVLVLVLDV